MSERTYTTTDKTAWGPGPWQEEPDKVQWTDASTGLPCLAVRNHYGAWCGYVGVPEGHPYFGAEYEAPEVEVHGGLTFAAACDEEGEEATSICHVPEPGQPDDVWWLGFDCAHHRDLVPGMESRYPADLRLPGLTYRTLDYVRGECADLARQLAAITA